MPLIKSKYSSKSLLENPTYNEVIKKIETCRLNPTNKAAVTIMALLGVRVGELKLLKRNNFVFFNSDKMPIPFEDIKEDLYNVEYLVVEVVTLKQRSHKKVIRRPVIPVNLITCNVLAELISYLKTLDNEQFFYPFSNVNLHMVIKNKFSKDFYCHLFRHISATRDGLANMNIHAMKKKYGWSNIDNASFYIDLNAQDLYNEEKRIYEANRISPGNSKIEQKTFDKLKQDDNQPKNVDCLTTKRKTNVLFRF